MPSVLICSPSDLASELRGTLVFRDDMERLVAKRVSEAMMMAVAARPDLVLVDRDLPSAEQFLKSLRETATTRRASVAIVARGDLDPSEIALLETGANAILRLPPGPEWDVRLRRLLEVPVRRQVRLPVKFRVEGIEGDPPGGALALNLSASGMLIEAHGLRIGDEVVFVFQPGVERVRGRAQVVRQATPTQFGVEFLWLEGNGAAVISSFIESQARP